MRQHFHKNTIYTIFENSDILCIQENFLPKQDLERLNSVNKDFHGVGESTTDLCLGIVHGRISGGVAILWHKKYDPDISVFRLNVDWCIAIKVTCKNNVFIVLNVYTPFECHDNEAEYLHRLSFISTFFEESECTAIYAMGDFNADISDVKSMFGQHVTEFCQDMKLSLSSKAFLSSDSYTYVSEAWGTTSWLDHCLCTADAHEGIEDVEILYGMATADHMPLAATLNIENLPELTNNENHTSDGRVEWAKLTECDLQYYNYLTEVSLGNITIPYDALKCGNKL